MLLHAFVPASRANGPGLRAVVYFQGCSLHCEKCWNPATHKFRGVEVPCSKWFSDLRKQAGSGLWKGLLSPAASQCSKLRRCWN